MYCAECIVLNVFLYLYYKETRKKMSNLWKNQGVAIVGLLAPRGATCGIYVVTAVQPAELWIFIEYRVIILLNFQNRTYKVLPR